MKLQKYSWVNSIRGYAILLVIMIHASQNFHVGFFLETITHTGDMGVQLFFIMSSFTLFNSYTTRHGQDPHHINIRFFIRRFFRIAPYYYIAGFFYVMYTVYVNKTPINLIYLISNYTFTNGLFLPAINYIPPGGWSVGIEILFYLTIPFLYKYVNSLKKAIILLFLSILFSNIVNFSIFYTLKDISINYWIELRSWELYFWLPNQFPVFVFGIVLFFICKEKVISVKFGNILLFTSCNLFFYLSLFRFELRYPEYFFQREYVYSVVFTLFGIGLYFTNNKSFCSSIIQKIGLVSFSMYLNHFIVLDILHQVYNKQISIFCSKYGLSNFIFEDDLMFIALYIITVLITYSFSKFTYTYIEKPGIALGDKIIKKYVSNFH